MNKLNLSLFLIVLAVGYAAGTWLFSQSPSSSASQNVIQSFTFTDIEGRTHNTEDFKGRTIILNFWATWCAPCVVEFPVLLQLAKDNPEVVLIALSSDMDDKTITKFLTKFGHKDLSDNVHIARDMNNITGGVFKTYKLPETLIIDGQGRLQHKLVGAGWTKEEAQKVLDKL